MSFCGIQYAKILRKVHDDDGTVFYHLQLYPLHYGSGMFLCAN